MSDVTDQNLVDSFQLVGDVFRDFLKTKKDLYTAVAARMYDVPERMVTKEQRHQAKLVVMTLLVPVKDTMDYLESL